MAARRFLVYQPNHGIGVELAMVHHAARLARLLDRTVVLPLLPILETQQYQGGVEEYFDGPTGVEWISTAEFLERHGGDIHQLFVLAPQWQPEYRSQVIRDRHPVWLDNIERHPYFELAGMRVLRATRMTIESQLHKEAARELFATDAPVIGFSYVHSLIEKNSTYEEPDRDPAWHTDVPPQPRAEFLRAVELALGGRPSIALQIRHGSRDNARAIHQVELPGIEEFLAHVPPDPGLVYVATDVSDVYTEVRSHVGDARHIETGHFTRDAVLELSACILAERFVGTDYSTFTRYILHARNNRGEPPESTVLLSERPISR
jgi:hypothetical protein